MNIVIVNQGGGKYLFEVPAGVKLSKGDEVKCDTRQGITNGVVWADSIETDEAAAKLIGSLTGAKFPLKQVVGKMECHAFEAPKPEPEKELFVPHLENSTGRHYGVIGKKTDYVDAVGRSLCVGDVVELFKGGASRGKCYVVETKLSYRGNKEKVFVMGLEWSCADGMILDGWKVVKIKDHTDLKNSESYNLIEACLSEY